MESRIAVKLFKFPYAFEYFMTEHSKKQTLYPLILIIIIVNEMRPVSLGTFDLIARLGAKSNIVTLRGRDAIETRMQTDPLWQSSEP